MRNYFLSFLVVALFTSFLTELEAEIVPMAYPAKAGLPDFAELAEPDVVHLDGFLGTRVLNNALTRLLNVDPEPLLAGFRKKPGSHPWIGEHAGKWLHAATLAWVYTGNPALRAKLDYVAAELVKAQEPDGYLGTYTPDKRFGLYPEADWDVWSHKYNLMGLLTYYHYTGNAAALNACRRMGDLLISTFGPGKKSILSAGTHMGMAATSVLEPMVLLYRSTGDDRYLQFARYIVRSWDEPNGPKIIASLLAQKSVEKTANGKAYEMLSNLVGLCELARASGDRALLEPVLNAWQDIVAHRLYLTGSASQGEHFHADYYLPNGPGANVSETCVTTTWIQLNSQLLRLTGEARFADQLERTFYNQLAAAQRPDGAEWCYFTPLEGTKPYGPGINCCVSSGPRGMAMVPPHALLHGRAQGDAPEILAINQFESATLKARAGGTWVRLDQRSDFPSTGSMVITVHPEKPIRFILRVRTPEWAKPLALTLEGNPDATASLDDGWTSLPARSWADGDRVTVQFKLAGRMISGDHGNQDKAALVWGPMVLAYDESQNDPPTAPALLAWAPVKDEPPVQLKSASPLRFQAALRSFQHPEPFPAVLTAFADAGAAGRRYQVWLRGPEAKLPENRSLFAFGSEKRSRPGNLEGSITDGDPASAAVTFDGQPQVEAWFAVSSDTPVTFARVVFTHGKNFHDGGWFDASSGKPQVQVQRQKRAPWVTVGTLSDYPETTAASKSTLQEGQSFTCRLTNPETAVALRVVGNPSCGDNPRQAFASCGELEAFAP